MLQLQKLNYCLFEKSVTVVLSFDVCCLHTRHICPRSRQHLCVQLEGLSLMAVFLDTVDQKHSLCTRGHEVSTDLVLGIVGTSAI